MVIIHEPAQGRFYTTVDGYTAHVSYRIENGGLDIRHTIVPEEIGGRGIASELVKDMKVSALSPHAASPSSGSAAIPNTKAPSALTGIRERTVRSSRLCHLPGGGIDLLS